ncbi:hypothetical protein [Streptomyces sp. BV333]|uniref:hypothetical protein n=1 Tax=Streptomyces sp. BV333 TaxID=2849673 RepID=UPI0027E20FA7|nr:hypothetical protein [Streptomyces sp. BV333]
MLSKSVPSGTLIPQESKLQAVNAFGVQAVVAYRRDAVEYERRAAEGTPPLTRPDVLDLLMGLPVGEAVPINTLSSPERRALKAAPKGVVVRSGGTVTRQVVQPLRVDLAIVPGRGWETAMEKAEHFTPFCARAVLVERPLRRKDDAILQADFYGIGLLALIGNELDVLVPPRAFVKRRHTVAGWKFLEDLYAQLA